MTGDKVVIDGRCLRLNSTDAWRFGVVVNVLPNGLILVECQPRGKERKARQIACAITWLLKDTPSLRTQMISAGVIPKFQNCQ